MYQTTNMGLTVWDQPDDDFNHAQLVANWTEVDQHDHSPGNGAQITAAGLAPNSVTPAQIAPQAVGNSELQPLAVGTSNLQEQSVTADKIAPGAISGGLIPTGGISIGMLDPTILPLGYVAMWWRPAGSAATPGGVWEAMDGRPWSTITNALGLSSGNIPDTRGLFARGADILGSVAPAIGATGGSNTVNLAHTHNVLAHTHTVPSHVHGITSDGHHNHTWTLSFGPNSEYTEGFTTSGLNTWYRTNSFHVGLTMEDFGGTQRQNVYGSLYLKNAVFEATGETGVNIETEAPMDSGGDHSHGGNTESSDTLTSGSSTSTTNSQLGSTSIVPANLSLLYIMRVR